MRLFAEEQSQPIVKRTASHTSAASVIARDHAKRKELVMMRKIKIVSIALGVASTASGAFAQSVPYYNYDPTAAYYAYSSRYARPSMPLIEGRNSAPTNDYWIYGTPASRDAQVESLGN